MNDLPAATEKPTLAARLEKALTRFDGHLGRMRNAFDRIHGSPSAPSEGLGSVTKATHITPLAISMDRAEQLVNQLGEILHRLDAIG